MARPKKEEFTTSEVVNVETPKPKAGTIRVKFHGNVMCGQRLYCGVMELAANDPIVRELRNEYTVIE